MDFETTQDYVRSCGREDTRMPKASVNVGKEVGGWRYKGKAVWKPQEPGGMSLEGQKILHEGGIYKE